MADQSSFGLEGVRKVACLSPYIASENIGDRIIHEYCEAVIEELFSGAMRVDLSTRDRPSRKSRMHLSTADWTLVCGTNLLSSHMRKYRQWNITMPDMLRIWLSEFRSGRFGSGLSGLKRVCGRDRAILMGAGWWQYQDAPDAYTRTLLRMWLSRSGLHSVRDSYTERMLREMGIENVVNTACPTMWRLTEAHCASIPVIKGQRVVTTFTDYMQDPQRDYRMLEILGENYGEVILWLQSAEDWTYLKQLNVRTQIRVLPPSLKAFDRLLEDGMVDYVGTRLHGGIRALNKGRRSLIVGVDNRAIEIGRDTGLPVLPRAELETELEARVNASAPTCIRLPEENITRWKAQFRQ